MSLKRQLVALGLIALVCGLSVSGFAQDTSTPMTVPQTTETAVNQALTYIDSAAKYLGQGVLYVLNLITDDRVSTDLEKPIGYLALITLILLIFGLLDFARKIIWIGIIVGWVLLVIRIVLDALNL